MMCHPNREPAPHMIRPTRPGLTNDRDVRQLASTALLRLFDSMYEGAVVVIVLVKVGVVSIAKLKEARPYVIVGAFVVGAVFTPPDVLSQVMLAVPLWLLYELGIILARFVEKPAGVTDHVPPGDAEAERELDRSEADSKKTG